MDRIKVINEFINKMKYEKYIELGTSTGVCFLRVNAKKKLAVDPEMRISRSKRFKALFRNPHNLKNEYYEMTSDNFFHKKKNYLKEMKPDIVFVDGLHTYEQSLNDVRNALKVVKPGGIVLMHDCNPIHELAAAPASSIEEVKKNAPQDWNGDWNGDVWKAFVHLKDELKSKNFFTLNTDCGIGVIPVSSKQINEKLKPEPGYKNLPFSYLAQNRESLLNLKPIEYLNEYIEENNN